MKKSNVWTIINRPQKPKNTPQCRGAVLTRPAPWEYPPKNNTGITLIALVITIIVLLILAGVSLSLVAGNDGILNKAESAVDATKLASAKEEAGLLLAEKKTEWYEKTYVDQKNVGTITNYLKTELGSGKPTTSGDYIVTIDENGKITITTTDGKKVPTEGTLGEGGKVSWKDEETNGATGGGSTGDAGETTPETPSIPEGLKVGSTVSYTPSGTYTEWTAEHSGYTSGYTLESGNSSTTNRDMTISSWKVFKIDESTGKVQLVPSAPTSNSVELYGANGYNNGVKLLNDVCSSLYGDDSKNITARSINMEDIESVLNYDPTEYMLNVQYGKQYSSAFTRYKTYPAIYAEEIDSVITPTPEGKNKTLGRSDAASDWVTGSTTAETSIQPYQTSYSLSNSDFSSKLNEGYSDILLPSGRNTRYWVASRCVFLGSSICFFEMRVVINGEILSDYMCGSGGGVIYSDIGLFPIISLSSELIERNATAGFSVK